MSRDRTSRRRFVRIAGAASVAATVGLAGCSSPGEEEDDEGGENGGGDEGGESGEGGENGGGDEGGEEDDSLTGPNADE
ncbi:hypothetical protein [Haloprofundus halophilus]|uniref:hypothetical protein n=1 Tax=Haloprofundus halophilus TaxID=2283527 RepID=UPI000E450A71|nr:hypothetical protein [Haloprofundus halophilus]